MNAGEFKTGDHMRYIPGHAHGDRHHPDCEDGVVTSVSEHIVFARFRPHAINSEACDPESLIKIGGGK